MIAKIWIVLSWFLLGCTFTTFLAFLASLHPNLRLWVMFLGLLFITVQTMGWIGDDAIASFLKIEVKTWWIILIFSLVCVSMGLGLWLFS